MIASRSVSDLGRCGAFLTTGRCDGTLEVYSAGEVLVEACCESCGACSAIPVGKLRGAVAHPEPEADLPDPWWQR